MKHLIMYNDVKSQIDSLLPDASHSLYALVTLFQDCDEQFNKLINEKSELKNNKELSISASMLFDAYELVEDGMNTMGMLIVNIGKDEQKGINQYVDVSEFIEPAKEIIPELLSMIHTVSSQMSDFIELHKSFTYQDISMLNPLKVAQYMDVNRKVSRISTIIHSQMVESHEEFLADVAFIADRLTRTSLVMEATESVKGSCFVSVIDDISIIEVGETKEEVIRNTKEYFDGKLDDSVKVLPCSNGVYTMVSHDGEIPESWEIVDGVVVLKDEKELFEQLEDITESKHKYKPAILRIYNEIDEKVHKEFESKIIKIDGFSVDNTYTIKIVPDTIINKTKFNGVDKRVILEIFRTLQKHQWFSSVKLDEDDKGVITLTMVFSGPDIDSTSKLIFEMINPFKKPIKARHAGFIPYYFDENGNVLVMTMIPSNADYGGNDPQLAKGTIDDGMDDKETAMKEASEEVGLKPNNLKFIKHLGIVGTNKPISVYYGEIKDPNDFNEPHWESGWSGWVDITNDISTIRDIHQPVFKKLLTVL